MEITGEFSYRAVLNSAGPYRDSATGKRIEYIQCYTWRREHGHPAHYFRNVNGTVRHLQKVHG